MSEFKQVEKNKVHSLILQNFSCAKVSKCERTVLLEAQEFVSEFITGIGEYYDNAVYLEAQSSAGVCPYLIILADKAPTRYLSALEALTSDKVEIWCDFILRDGHANYSVHLDLLGKFRSIDTKIGLLSSDDIKGLQLEFPKCDHDRFCLAIPVVIKHRFKILPSTEI